MLPSSVRLLYHVRFQSLVVPLRHHGQPFKSIHKWLDNDGVDGYVDDVVDIDNDDVFDNILMMMMTLMI